MAFISAFQFFSLSAFSEGPEPFVEFREPAALLRIGELAFAVKFNAGIRDVRGRHGVVARDVIDPHQAVKHHLLGFTGESDDAGAFDHEIAVGQHIGDEHGGARGKALGIADVTTA